MTPRLGDWQPSDAGPWRTYDCRHSNDQHVVPGFEGRRHVLARECWCHPRIEVCEDGELVQHNVAQ